MSPEHADNIRQEARDRETRTFDQLGIFANNLVPKSGDVHSGSGLIIGLFCRFYRTSIQCICTGKSRLKINFSTQSINLAFCNNGNPCLFSCHVKKRYNCIFILLRKPQSWKQSWKKYLIPTIVEIAIVVLVLYVGSVVEWQKLFTANIKAENIL